VGEGVANGLEFGTEVKISYPGSRVQEQLTGQGVLAVSPAYQVFVNG
jgi:hypothetical protein